MIRPVLAALIAASILLFVWQYAKFTDRIRPEPVQIIEDAAAGQYDVRVVCTCDCAGNAFGSPALRVRFRDRVLIERVDKLAAGEVLLIRDVPDVKLGFNDFLVHVTPAETAGSGATGAFSVEAPAAESSVQTWVARAVRVEILRDGFTVADELLWSATPGPFGELVRINVGGAVHTHSDQADP
ncbi:MAG: hypothetical protein ACR2NP_09175 [Pirellulaceae bacterium]